MNTFECPNCGDTCEVETQDLPDNACDEMNYECPHCDQLMKIGWHAEVEVRSVEVCAGDISDVDV